MEARLATWLVVSYYWLQTNFFTILPVIAIALTSSSIWTACMFAIVIFLYQVDAVLGLGLHGILVLYSITSYSSAIQWNQIL